MHPSSRPPGSTGKLEKVMRNVHLFSLCTFIELYVEEHCPLAGLP